MSYVNPAGNAAHFNYVGAAPYTAPAGAAADFVFVAQARMAAPSPLGAPALLARPVVTGAVSAPGPLGAVALLARQPLFARTAAPSPLAAPALLAVHDFTGQLGDAATLFVMDLITPGGTLRIPISSWQATLQTGSSNYVQCVVPACAPWVTSLNTATEFVIYRRALLPSGVAIEYEMARAPAQQAQFDRGPERYTCTLSGYTTAFAASVNPPAVYDRTLAGIRTISNASGGASLRVRCAVDWLLRPGHRAYVEGTPMVVGYINYYAPSGFDSYMDVGQQA